jgi:sensor domain CHASE-containing protein/nitrogen-specific signal transduction histidine kinase
MSLRKKTLLIIGATLLCLVGLVYTSSRRILLGSFKQLENETVQENTRRGLDSVRQALDTLTITARDWAYWDDTYSFVQDPDQSYIDSNIIDQTFITIHLNALLFFNSSNELVLGRGFDLHSGKQIPIPSGLEAHLVTTDLLQTGNDLEEVSGLIRLPDGLMMIAALPILPSAMDGPSQGTLVFGRFLDRNEVQRIAEDSNLLLRVYRLNDVQMPSDFQKAYQNLRQDESSIYIQTLNAQSIAGYALLDDVHGNPIMLLRVDMSRDIYEQGQASIWYFMLALMSSGVVFSVMTILLLEQTVLSRLAHLSSSVDQIGKRSDPSSRVTVTGNDELSRLAKAVNRMLEALEQSQKRIQESEASQAALAVHNAQLYEAERHERLLAQTLQKAAAALATSIKLEDTLNLIIQQLGEVVEYDRATVFLVEGDQLQVVGAYGFAPHDHIYDVAYQYSSIPLFHEAMLSGEPVALSDAQNDDRWVQLPGFSPHTRGWIGTPLIARGVVIGFLSVSCNQPDEYTERDVEAVATFAQQAALAVENARILSELENSLNNLREVQNQLVRTARLSAAGEIAAGVAHQINNPLTTVLAEIHLLMMDLDPESPSYESAQAIQEAASRAGMVVRRLLDLTRTHPYIMEPLDINYSLQSSVALIRAQTVPHIARLEVDLTPDLPLIEASAQHIEDVLINLLLNARDAVSKLEGGMIKVTSGLSATGDAIKMTVQDNGPGIAPKHINHIFEPFFTTKDYGTGLGLSICHEVVTRHGGVIQVDSVEGQGTTFTITLPLRRTSEPVTKPLAPTLGVRPTGQGTSSVN